MSWSVNLNNGNFIFDTPTTRWSLRDRFEIKDDGSTDFQETALVVRSVILPDAGTASADVAKNVTDKFITLRDFLKQESPLRIQLILDGVTKYDFIPGSQLGTPKCRDISQVDENAVNATHVKFEASFYMKTPKSGGGGGGSIIAEFLREVTEESTDGNVTKKAWHASARGFGLQTAKAKVMSFKPKGVKPLTQKLTERIGSNEFEASWTWERGANQKVSSFRETLQFTPGGAPWFEDPVIGKKSGPFFHEGRNRSGTMKITMEQEGTDLTSVNQAPAEHFKKAGGYRRDRTKESAQTPAVLIDPAKGIYRAVFEEYWFIPFDVLSPQPGHGAHNIPFPAQNAPNGAIGGSQGGQIAP